MNKPMIDWQSIRRLEEFEPVLGEPSKAALIWFTVACLARIRHLLGPDGRQLADVIKEYAEGGLDWQVVLEAEQAFRNNHYTPRIVRNEEDTADVDIGEFDSLASEAVGAASYLLVGDLIYPEDNRFLSTRTLFWLAQGMAESCRHAVMATIPDLPWLQEELPPEMEPFRDAVVALSPEQRRQLRQLPEINPTLHAVDHALLDAAHARLARRNDAWDTEELEQCNLIREVIPPPFTSPIASSWRTSTVMAVGRGIYERRAFDGMPVLADALEEGGCAEAHILEHCRSASPHFRGCWALRLILDRE